MPFYQKQLRSGVGANEPASTMFPGQFAVNTEIRKLWVGDANGADGAADPVLLTPITLYNGNLAGPGGAYNEGDLVVDNGDIYKIAADGNPVLYVPEAGAIAWGLHLQGSPVPGWTAGAEDGLILERDGSCRMQIVTNSTGVASINFGDASDRYLARILWFASLDSLRLRIDNTDRLDIREDYIRVTEQLRALDGDINAPSISFEGDPTLGFYYSGGGIMSLAQGGVRLMRWDPIRVQSYVPVLLNNAGNDTPNITFSADTDTGIGQGTPNSMEFLTGGTVRMSIDNTRVSIKDRLEFEENADLVFNNSSTPRKNMITFHDLNGDFAIGYLDSVTNGDLVDAHCLTFTAGAAATDGFLWGDHQAHSTMTLSNRGVLQVRLALWTGVNGDTLMFPATTPPSSFTESSVSRTYTTSGSTVVVVERDVSCYMSIIGSTAAGINFGDPVSETAAVMSMNMATREFGIDVDSQSVMRMSAADGVTVDSMVMKANTVAVLNDFVRLTPLVTPAGSPNPGAADSATNQLRAMNVAPVGSGFAVDPLSLPPSVAAPVPGEGVIGIDMKQLLELLVEFGREADVRMTGIGA